MTGGIFNSEAEQRRRTNRKPSPGLRIYSVPVWLDGRELSGGFDLNGAAYKLVFAPSRAEADDSKLHLEGRLSITDARGRTRSVDSARATLAATQGGMNAAPVRRQIIAAGAQTGTTATSNQKQQRAGENEKPSEAGPDQQEKARASNLPETEYTDASSFVGVMYMHLEPLDNRRLGVAADLSRVQLNARLAARDDTARSLHNLYSYAVEALYVEHPNKELAKAALDEINRVLSS